MLSTTGEGRFDTHTSSSNSNPGCRRHDSVYSIVMIDVGHFKAFNDTQGHQAGDDGLQRIAQAILSSCRAIDIAGRCGGEEFVVLATGTDSAAVVHLAGRIRGAVSDLKLLRRAKLPHPSSPTDEYVSASLGVADCTTGSWEDVLKQADVTLYAAKEGGRNRVCVDAVAPQV